MTDAPYDLDLARAKIVLEAIRETCKFRGWDLFAVHVRSTHVHLVAGGISDPDRAINDLKAYASRALKLIEPADRQRWARGVSTRALFTKRAIDEVVRYVVDRQGEPMAVYVMDPLQPRA